MKVEHLDHAISTSQLMSGVRIDGVHVIGGPINTLGIPNFMPTPVDLLPGDE